MMLTAMQTRRKFLRNSALLLPSVALAGRGAWAAEHIPIGLQLYTVRQEVAQNLPGTLRQVHEIGYTEVEGTSELYTRPAATVRQIVRDAQLRMPSAHFDYNKLSGQFDYAKDLGLSWVVCPAIDHSLWGSEDGFRTAAKQFNEWGRRAKEMGMRFAFHNHDYEFRSLGNKTGYEILVGDTDPDLVFFEIDCYWAVQAGQNPLEMMRKMGRRVKMLHLKDRAPGFPTSFNMGPTSAHFVPVGSGSIAWKPILAEAERLGVEHYFVEQDHTAGDPMVSIRKSYDYLHSIT